VAELVSELENCSGLVVVSCYCEKLRLGIFREPRGRGTSAVESHYQATAREGVTVDTSACV
jgi:hypothetical protein